MAAERRVALATANEQLMKAVRETEQRVADFHALLDVVQSEAEDVFVSTASTVRGGPGSRLCVPHELLTCVFSAPVVRFSGLTYGGRVRTDRSVTFPATPPGRRRTARRVPRAG